MDNKQKNQDLVFRPFWTLFKKEVWRFSTVMTQTLLAPVVSASLYLFIFGVSLGKRISLSPDYTYLQFVVPGLILMGVVNNSFANSSSSLFMSRYLGSIVDLLVTPLTPTQFLAGYTLAAMLRGFLVGLVILLVSLFFTNLPWVHPFAALGVIFLASFLFSQFGIVAAIFSKKFRHSLNVYKLSDSSAYLFGRIILSGIRFTRAMAHSFKIQPTLLFD